MKLSIIFLLTHSLFFLFCSTIKANSIEGKTNSAERAIYSTTDSSVLEKASLDTSKNFVMDSTHLKTARRAIRFSLGLPYVNLFNFQFPGQTFKAIGFLGVGAGVDFFYKKNHYISLNVGASTSAGFPNKKSYGYDTTAAIFYANIRNNFILGDFSFGYGVNLSQIEWHNKIVTDSINLNQSLGNTVLGLSFSAQYRLGKSFYFDASYQPDFLLINPSLSYKYQHYISFGFVYKLALRKGTNQVVAKKKKPRKVYIFY
ncbi:hypothetical protein [Arachidicoccus sp.]|uniref:hypothetical protein n=1 Tax=Arachidicoccus sp. TaxID=1872624 RepID=UPI003D196A6A